MLLATQGSIEAGCLALEHNWAINLSGGYHHATKSFGGGFCIYPDITLTIDHLRKHHSDRVNKVMIIDLDAHQGNGHERDFIKDGNTFILDCYNP
jgi:histone deacetylase 11